jgi:membrane protein YdbS with pleckstrin-like domain
MEAPMHKGMGSRRMATVPTFLLWSAAVYFTALAYVFHALARNATAFSAALAALLLVVTMFRRPAGQSAGGGGGNRDLGREDLR